MIIGPGRQTPLEPETPLVAWDVGDEGAFFELYIE